MSKSEPQTFGFWQIFCCGVVKTAFYLAIGRFWLKKNLLKKVWYLFLTFCYFGPRARTLGLFVENLSFGSSKLKSSWTETFCWKLHFLWETSLLFLSVFSASVIEENLLAFPKKTGGWSKMHSMRAQQGFSEKKEFWEKIFLLNLFGTWGKKHWTFNIFSHGCVKTSIHLSIGPFWWILFQKTYNSSSDLMALDRKNFSLLSWIFLAG